MPNCRPLGESSPPPPHVRGKCQLGPVSPPPLLAGDAPRARRILHPRRKSTLQTSEKEVCLTEHLMCPVPGTIHPKTICCECQARFRGHLPVLRSEATLPYWVPLSLRPRKQTTKACPCSCHRFGGHLPMPRDQAVMPYWVPPVLRFTRKVLKRRQTLKGMQEASLDLRSWYNRWRICCDGHLLLKWQQLQALQQDELPAPGWGMNPPTPFLPNNLNFLTFFQAILKVIAVIRVIAGAWYLHYQSTAPVGHPPPHFIG
ncbi:uncharacterized protein C16orf95 homolog isoform X2 [Erinaceus europaeus]|uniref:Uncharacterized protein C16orf95 homolog isoform X2 n=1 Tax=Erinaceus europaeus TaxID=9365 RepID=A0ABM3WWT0_ERIEU|nr:uncharacterized protein C16orf95 homolog isoform X2 [Erinaceus europaeus]